MIQSAWAVPGGVTFRFWTLTRPSTLVELPSTSAKPAAGSTTCGGGGAGARGAGRPRSPCPRRRGRGGRGRGRGSRPADRRRAGRARRSGRRRRPRGCRRCRARAGGAPSPTPGGARRGPASSVTRPGRRPGARPMSRAPRTLARRSTGRNRVSGLRTSSADAASTMASLDSASDWRPITTVTGPDVEQVAGGGQRVGVDAAGVGARRRPVEQRPHGRAGLARSGEQRDRGQRREAGRVRRHLDDLDAVVDHRVAQAQEQDRQLLLEVGAEEQHRAAGRAHLVDRGAREAEHQLGRQAVAELGVDVVGADDALGQLGPGVGGLVGEPGAAEHGDAGRRRRRRGSAAAARSTRVVPAGARRARRRRARAAR